MLRAVKAYVRNDHLPEAALGRARRRDTDDRLPAIVAAIKGADQLGCKCSMTSRFAPQPENVRSPDPIMRCVSTSFDRTLIFGWKTPGRLQTTGEIS